MDDGKAETQTAVTHFLFCVLRDANYFPWYQLRYILSLPFLLACFGVPRTNIHREKALETLGRFETMTAKLESETKLLSSARDALSLEPMERDVLGPMQVEITDLREVSLESRTPVVISGRVWVRQQATAHQV